MAACRDPNCISDEAHARLAQALKRAVATVAVSATEGKLFKRLYAAGGNGRQSQQQSADQRALAVIFVDPSYLHERRSEEGALD
jgi:hypothetical protein